MMIRMTTTADRIRSLRRENGLTQEDLAARADCGLATIQRAEAGRPLSAASLASIAAAFDVPASALAADPEADFEPYLPLRPIESCRALVALLLDAQRIDFAFCEIDSLADAEMIQALHDMCHEIAALETPLVPIHRVTRELEARDQLSVLSAAGFRVGGANYDITAFDVDDDGSGGFGVERVCALVPSGVERPSDYDGIAYVAFDDAEGWQRKLVTELHAADVPVSQTWWHVPD